MISKKTKLGAHAPRVAFISDFTTKTEKNLSKNMNTNARAIPKAKFKPIPPLLLNEETETASSVKIKTEKGMLNLLFLSRRWSFSSGDPLNLSC